MANADIVCLKGLTRGQNLNDSHDPTIFSLGCLDHPRASIQKHKGKRLVQNQAALPAKVKMIRNVPYDIAVLQSRLCTW